MAHYVLDRFEGNWAILEAEDGSMRQIDRVLLTEAHEGDVLVEMDGQWSVDHERTRQIREAVRQRLARLTKN